MTTTTTGDAVRNVAPHEVERPRLLLSIAEAVAAGARVVALTAPAGAGKTTVLNQWLATRRAAGAVTVTVPGPRAGATAGLWPWLHTAIQGAGLPEDVEATLVQVLRPAVSDPDQPAPTSAPDLATPVWLGIDDAHEWSSVSERHALGRILACAGPMLRIVVGARFIPGGLLSAALMDGTAHEFRSTDLAFDATEARALLLAENIDLAESDLETLLCRTEGWAAGLRLAAIAMGPRRDRARFVSHFAGTDRTVADYLVTQVLTTLPLDHIDLLLDVSVADRVSLDLAQALTGRPGAGEVLEELTASNALVHVAPDDPDSYELHPLLRSYLRAESQRRDQDRHHRRQLAAIAWHEAMGDIRGAIRHAVAAADWDRAESLTADHCVRIAVTDGPEAMREILRSLPAWVQVRPAAAGAAALTSALDDNLAAAELDLAVLATAAGAGPRLEAYRAIAVLASARTRRLTASEITDSLAALDTAAGQEPDLALLGRSLASMAYAMLGDLETASAMARTLARIARARGLDFLLLRTLAAKCAVAGIRSDLTAVRTLAAEAIDLAERRGWHSSSRLTTFHVEAALAAWQCGDDAGAATHAHLAVDTADAEADPLGAAAAVSVRDLTVGAAEAGLDLATVGHVQAFNEYWPLLPPAAVATFAAFELMVTLRCHEADLAGVIIRRAEEVIPDAPDLAVFKAMRHLYVGHAGPARDELRRARGRTLLTPRTRVIAAALSAQLADEADRPAQSHEALLHAIGLAERNNLIRCLLNGALSVRTLLLRGRGRFGRHEAFVAEVLDFATTRPYPDTGNGLLLTGKELAVLRDLPSMLSLREIADAHVVSINTVKTHVRSVYRKLGVATRREAVDLARQTGLL